MSQKKKVANMLIIILILQIILPVVSVIIEIELKSIAYEGTEFYINSAQDLWKLAELINNGDTFKDVTVYLSADINLGCDEYKPWVPISTFRGSFDGQGHIISGLYMNAEDNKLGLFGSNSGTIENLIISNSYLETTSTSNIYIGFITSYNSEGIIRNCSVTNSEIKVESKGYIYAGGICGYNSRGIIEYCNNYAKVYTKNIAGTGGITGENYGLIRKSKNMGEISGDSFTNYNSCGIGGIAGSNHSKVNLCENYGKIKSNATSGGVVGTNFDGYTEIIASSNWGTVEGKYCGGIVGRNGSTSNIFTTGGKIINSYNIGELTASSNAGTICYSNKDGGNIQNCYYLESNFEAIVYDDTKISETIKKTKEEMQTSMFVELLNNEGKQYEYIKNNYPDVDLTVPNIEVKYTQKENDYVTVTVKSDEFIRNVQGWIRSQDQKTLTKTFYINYKEELIIEDYNYNQTTVMIEIDSLKDNIIQENNYYIYDFEDLQIFTQEVNKGNSFEGKNIYLMNNINIDENYEWEVIGKLKENAFKGNFYGNNNKVNGININEYSYYKGFFGYIENSSIYNLVVVGAIDGESKYTGGIAACAKSSHIENCINNILINEKYNSYDNNFSETWGAKVGGIAGYLSDTTIVGCINNGEIIYVGNGGSSGNVGGIVGDGSTKSIILSSTNNAGITSTNAYDVGGIVGEIYNGEIQGCNNKGNIISNSVPQGLGGITGETNVGILINNYNLGNVIYNGTSTSNGTASIYNIGGIVGRTYNLITLMNCYNVGNVYMGGIVGTVGSKSGTIKNNYYLEENAKYAYYSSDIEEIEIIKKNDEELKSKEFVELLNNGTDIWRYDINNINNGYPYTAKLIKISIINEPNKTKYKEGENFNEEGMKIIAIYDDEITKEISDYTIIDGTNLKVDQTQITISYTENRETKTTNQIITVEHDYEGITTFPTCIKQGYTVYKCTICKKEYIDKYTNALGHNYKDTVTEPTATTQGYTTHTCTRCGNSYKDSYTEPLGEPEKLYVSSNSYNVGEKYITKIKPNTTVASLKEQILTNKETKINIYNSDGKELKDTDYVGTGTKITFKFGEETKEYTLVVTGDLNGDGKIGNGDLIKLARARVELETLGEAYEKAGDLNNDGKIGDGDIMMLARALVGLIEL